MIGRGAKPAAKVVSAVGHPLDELLAAALLDQQPRVRALERLEHHQLGAQQPDAVDVERRRALDLRGLGEVDEQPRRGDAAPRRRGGRRPARAAGAGGRDRALEHDPVRRVDGDDLAVAQPRVASPVPTTHGMPSSRETIAAWQVMPPESVTIAGGAAHQRHPVGRGHVGHEHVALRRSGRRRRARRCSRTGPLALPGRRAQAATSSSPSPAGSASAVPPAEVTGRDWSIHTRAVRVERPLGVLRRAVVLSIRHRELGQRAHLLVVEHRRGRLLAGRARA